MRYARALVAAVLAVGLLALTPAPTATAGRSAVRRLQRSSRTWNQIAVGHDRGRQRGGPAAQGAHRGLPLHSRSCTRPMYNAVVGIEGGYQPYRFHAHAPRGASSQAAAVAAAHTGSCVNYSPAQEGARSTRRTPRHWPRSTTGRPRTRGIEYGRARRGRPDRRQRADDGRNATILFTPRPDGARGVAADAARRWLRSARRGSGYVRPMLIRSGDAVRPRTAAGPHVGPLHADFNEVKALGSSTTRRSGRAAMSASRPCSGRATRSSSSRAGLRGPGGEAAPRHRGLGADVRGRAHEPRGRVDRDLVDQAPLRRSGARSPRSSWPTTDEQPGHDRGRRPRRRSSASPRLMPPATPPYPDYVSGYNGVDRRLHPGAAGQPRHAAPAALADLDQLPGPDPRQARIYDPAGEVRHEVIDARVWLGLHFRFADTAAARMGRQVADYGLDHYFGPAKACRSHR